MIEELIDMLRLQIAGFCPNFPAASSTARTRSIPVVPMTGGYSLDGSVSIV